MTDFEMSTLLRNATQADLRAHGTSVVRAALLNAVTVGAYNMGGGRQHFTAADLRLFDTVWRAFERHFQESGDEVGAHIPVGEARNEEHTV